MANEKTLDRVLDAVTPQSWTVRQYLQKLLTALWIEGEQFSGKRPLGNSGWEYDLYCAIARAGLIEAEFDGEALDYISDAEEKKADDLIRQAISHVFNP